MKRTRGSGRAVIALVAVLAVVGVLSTACVPASRVAVRAVARGVPAAAPFFKNLGKDIAIGAALSGLGGVLEGGDPGLYGGTRDAGHCDKAALVDFLQAPENRRKAREWADVKGLGGIGEIDGYVKKLTPVLLRTDTLVRNHDFKKGRAAPFDALLEAGIAVLVDELGVPAVQCSCGNPLRAFEHSVDEADVEFDGRNKKWTSYDEKRVAKVEPAPEEDPVEVYQLVDVEDPDAGLAREAGSNGTDDTPLPTAPDPENPSVTPSDSAPTDTVTVPDVQGWPATDATATLETQGMQVTTVEEFSDTAAPGTVLAQSPDPGTEVPAGSGITLTIASDGTTVPDPDPSPTDAVDPLASAAPDDGEYAGEEETPDTG
ncbi:DUF6777 domain-containing protein [Streptomyces flavalbus]|uniref:DUF6777 domain-containing protein n=1 Tax=Streptomyces flavalbus TaxID=2665155 RepID=A0ABW2WE29_9ACTN